ncbi:MAG: hypothetical protein CVV05_01155 [Gammaproteobacteria bacterium HGW-Gammaproteobacteria-1]|jgi:hypothetical protein|nr:MAG: hypothetical protein CVV05_01155 [Gammaproteobacteria bacterium HGW-Gammaproteobacteria-1]
MTTPVYHVQMDSGAALSAFAALGTARREPREMEASARGLCRRRVRVSLVAPSQVPHLGHLMLSLAVLEASPSLLRSHGRAAADYLARTWLPSKPDLCGVYCVEFGPAGAVEATLPQFLMLAAAYGQREARMELALDAHAPEWRFGVEQAWRYDGAPPFFLDAGFFHRDIAAARMRAELARVSQMSADKAAYYLAHMPPFLMGNTIPPAVVSMIHDSGMELDHPVPGVGTPVGQYLDAYLAAENFPWLQPLQQQLVSRNLVAHSCARTTPLTPAL